MTNDRYCQGILNHPDSYFPALEKISKNWDTWQAWRAGLLRSTTATKDRYIVLSNKNYQRKTASPELNQFLSRTGKRIFRKTVDRCLQQAELCALRHFTYVCLEFTEAPIFNGIVNISIRPRTTGLVNLDKRRFRLSSDHWQQSIWCDTSSAYNTENIH